MARLSEITEEEKEVLEGRTIIDRDLYMRGRENTVSAQKLLAAGKLITLRPHLRFLPFPEHTHDYVELVYMCTGKTVHIVNGNRIELGEGEILMMNQSATHEVLESGREDVAVNFIVLPEFFESVLPFVGEEETPLRRFLISCLCSEGGGSGFLHCQVSGVKPIQNLVENLLFSLLYQSQSKRKTSQITMALLFMQIMEHTDRLVSGDSEQEIIFRVLSYIERYYAMGSLSELSKELHYDFYALSREIKRKTGKTYTELVQEKRLRQAAFLLKNTDRRVDEIAHAVGYENIGYFHRIFKSEYGVSPRGYRQQMG